jgi:hypothetical protein
MTSLRDWTSGLPGSNKPILLDNGNRCVEILRKASCQLEHSDWVTEDKGRI